ncbi:MAG TPA: helix-turn-helix domain-containing protein [Polyangiaceae bacterium]|nr:helix-turn-helix domain-containing protein [Polyangiaceae bacterium]
MPSESPLAHALLVQVLDAIESDPALAQRARALLLGEVPASKETLLPLKSCGVSVRTLRGAIKRGELEASLVGRELLVRAADLQTWIDGRRVRADEHEHVAPNMKKTPAQRAIDRARLEGSLRVVGGSKG